MVAFSKSDLPDAINSVEAVAVWASTVLANLHPDLTVVEAAGSAEMAISAAPWKINSSNPPGWRHIARTSIALNSDWQKGGKIWNYTIALSGATIPTEFKS